MLAVCVQRTNRKFGASDDDDDDDDEASNESYLFFHRQRKSVFCAWIINLALSQLTQFFDKQFSVFPLLPNPNGACVSFAFTVHTLKGKCKNHDKNWNSRLIHLTNYRNNRAKQHFVFVYSPSDPDYYFFLFLSRSLAHSLCLSLPPLQQCTEFIEFSAYGSHDGLVDNEWLSSVHIHEDHNHASTTTNQQRCHHNQITDEINSKYTEHRVRHRHLVSFEQQRKRCQRLATDKSKAQSSNARFVPTHPLFIIILFLFFSAPSSLIFRTKTKYLQPHSRWRWIESLSLALSVVVVVNYEYVDCYSVGRFVR